MKLRAKIILASSIIAIIGVCSFVVINKYTTKRIAIPFLKISPTSSPIPELTEEEKKKISEENTSDNRQTHYLTFNKVKRSYVIHLPVSWDRRNKIPLLFVFHGAGGDGRNMELGTGFSDLSDKDQFIAVYPNGLGAKWNYIVNKEGDPLSSTDDLAFVKALISELEQKYPVDSSRIYASGFSNGGYFVHWLACSATDIFSGFATVGASMPERVTSNCHPTTPKILLMIVGSNDSNGGLSVTQGTIISAKRSLEKWTSNYKCPNPPNELGTSIKVSLADNCKDDSSVTLITLTGIGHDWVQGEDKANVFDTGRTIGVYFSLIPQQ